MKLKTFIPVECDIFLDDRMCALINEKGTSGYGVYMILLIELRNRKDYCLDGNSLKMIARNYNIRRKLIEDILYNYDLFTVDRMPDGNILITSEYVTRIMGNYDSKIAQSIEYGKKGADKRWQKKHSLPIATEQNITEQNITTEEKEKEVVADVVVADDKENNAAKGNTGNWKTYVSQALTDRPWVECQGMHSALGIRFMKYETHIANLFINHVITHGKEHELHSVADVKYYFANFVRQGTPTGKRITEELNKLEQEEKQATPYPFETIDPDTGKRTYLGKSIPAEAPPRPNPNAVWAESVGKWIS